MKRIIIGTAGHIDHGKTSMIHILTGVDTDRLKEEKERGISIELGFAGFDIPGIGKIGVVDVPGHEKFIKNMLAGATGIDLVLFVIAADEGVMPQTVEHLDILNLLDVKNGIIVLTKIDMIDDDEWLDMIKEEVREKVKDTFLSESPIIPFSAVTKEGKDELLQVIKSIADKTEDKSIIGNARLPIDRVFTIKGFGTVVTGTLWSGKIKVGDFLDLQPSQKRVRVRSLQVHDTSVEEAYAGQRTAVGIHGVEKSKVKRGETLVSPNTLTQTFMLDARLNLLKHTSTVLKNRTRLHFHLGTQEVLARVVLLENEQMASGDSQLVQFRFETPVVADLRDRFVIRSYSPVHTIGGGVVIDTHPPKHKRFKKEVIEHLKTVEKGKPEEIVEEIIAKKEISGITLDNLKKSVDLSDKELDKVIKTFINDEKIIKFGNYLLHKSAYEIIAETIESHLRKFHKKYPYLLGDAKENLKGKLPQKIPQHLSETVLKNLVNEGRLEFVRHKVKLKEHNITLSEEQEKIKNKIIRILSESGFMPPSYDDLIKNCVDKKNAEIVLTSMLETNKAIKISSNLLYLKSVLEKGEKLIVQYLKDNQEITISEAKRIFDEATRKYTVPLMEYFDKKGVTTRWGDKRFLNE